jgi:hypothetical protein
LKRLVEQADEMQRGDLKGWAADIERDLQAARQKASGEPEPPSSIAEESADKSQ